MESSETQNNQGAGKVPSKTGNPMLMVGVSFFVGLFIGLVILGWWAWPVKWENASVEHLRADLQDQYMIMTIDSYTLRRDVPLALDRMEALGPQKTEILQRVMTSPPDGMSIQAATELNGLLLVQGGQVDPNAPGDDGGGGSGAFLLIACAFTFIIGGVLVFMYLRGRGGSSGIVAEEGTSTAAIQQAAAITREAQTQQTDYVAMGADPPIAQWMTTYLIGDDLFDDSFSIDSPAGEFMGECGVGIADTVGVGEPKRVSAFEVWLFDKNDIQTITKVVMSHHIFSDEASVGRLAAKGEPVQAMVGEEIVLETQTLQMICRIVDMAYGEGALPERSHFERATLELAVWAKV